MLQTLLRQSHTIIYCVEKTYLKLHKRFTGVDVEGVEVYHENVPTLITLNDCCVAETDHCKNRGKYVKEDKYIYHQKN